MSIDPQAQLSNAGFQIVLNRAFKSAMESFGVRVDAITFNFAQTLVTNITGPVPPLSTGQLAYWNNSAGNTLGSAQLFGTQIVSSVSSGTLTPNPELGTVLFINLDHNVNVNIPSAFSGTTLGARLVFVFAQNNTGYFAPTFNASYLNTSLFQARQGPGQVSIAQFAYNGTNWVLTSFYGIDTRLPVNVKDYGTVGDGSANDTTAIQAAINATFLWDSGGLLGRELFLPAGKYKITSTLQVKGNQGFRLVGEGRYATQIQWFGPANTGAGTQPMLRINSSQHIKLQDFTLWGNASAKPSEGIFFDYNPVVFAATAITIQDVLVSGTAATGNYDYGIRFSGAYGNNSEVEYFSTTIERFAIAGISLEGSQQKSHSFYGCQINGGWDGVLAHAGGHVGVDLTLGSGGQGGSFQWYGGGVSGCSIAAFRPGPPNDPILIDGCQSESCYRFVDTGSTATVGIASLTIRNCRIDNINDHPADMVRLSGYGPYIIEGNQINAGSTSPLPYILINSGGGAVKARVKNNIFLSPNSATQRGVIVDPDSGEMSGLDIGDNQYVNISQNIQEQIEFLNSNNEAPFTFPMGATLFRADFPGHEGKPCINVDHSSFTANALTQSVKIYDLPRGTKIKSAYIYQYNTYIAPSLVTCQVRLGTSSGANDLLLDADIASPQHFYGRLPTELGINLTTPAQGGYIADFFNTTGLYVTVTNTGTNVGNGSVSNFTGGYFFVILDLELVQRFVYGA